MALCVHEGLASIFSSAEELEGLKSLGLALGDSLPMAWQACTGQSLSRHQGPPCHSQASRSFIAAPEPPDSAARDGPARLKRWNRRPSQAVVHQNLGFGGALQNLHLPSRH